MHLQGVPGLTDFLLEFPLMAVRPVNDGLITLAGDFEFRASYDGDLVHDSFELIISVPENFPRALPQVSELGKRIPKGGGYHVNYDGTLCLGSPLRLLLKLGETGNLLGFAQSCLIPYLFAISKKLKEGGQLVFSELDHGDPGVIKDYMDIFGLKTDAQVNEALVALTMKKRRANKGPCPCRCGRRLGKCKLNKKIRSLRKLASRAWFGHVHSTIIKDGKDAALQKRIRHSMSLGRF